MLIEVMISAMLVGLIAIATLNGFDATNRVSADERHHSEGALLAAESQEQLRTDAATVFDTAQNNYEHSYKTTIGGTTYSVNQSVVFLNATSENTACSVTETKRQQANKYRIASSVTWPQLGSRPAVTETSTVTPPSGSALEIDVGNAATPTAGISGVTAFVKYTPAESTTTTSLEGVTQANGCVVFAAIPSTSAIVEIAEKQGFVTPSGESKWPTKEVAIAPNITTHYPVTLNEGGAIQGEFNYEGAAAYKNKSNKGTKEFTETVTGDTFVAYNGEMESTPDFEVGSTKGTFNAAGEYQVATGTYAASATTPKESTKYPNGNLFPFLSPGAWTVYAGDCTANNPNNLNAAITNPTGYVKAATTTSIKIPTAYLLLNVYKKTTASPTEFEETGASQIMLTDKACKSIEPDNETSFSEPKREQHLTTSGNTQEYGGHLEHPFQPLGEGKLCLAYNSGTKHYTFTTTYKLTTEEQYPRNIFLEKTGASSYTETVERLPSKTHESATVEVAKISSGEAKCS